MMENPEFNPYVKIEYYMASLSRISDAMFPAEIGWIIYVWYERYRDIENCFRIWSITLS